ALRRVAGMRDQLQLQIKDQQRAFGPLERELIYYRDRKRCAECGSDVIWMEAEIHHIEQHRHGGPTILWNGALVHRHCHPKGSAAEEAFAEKWRQSYGSVAFARAAEVEISNTGIEPEDDDGE